MRALKRRSVLKAMAAAGAATFAPVPFSIGKPGPSANSKLNVAMIGAGNIAKQALTSCNAENIVALADVDSTMLLQHSDKCPQVETARKFEDFRVMLDKMGKEIDAVCINTPDHTHFVATMDAMQRGMHVCTQKPLTHNIWEARMLKKAKDKYGVITNMAAQGHTYDGIRRMREWIEADVFGQITEVHSWRKGPDWAVHNGVGNSYFHKPEAFPPPQSSVPANLNWDLWKGPVVTDLPFNHLYHPKAWRGFHLFGNGIFGDWMPHIADAPIWGLELFDPLVAELEAVEGGNEWIVPDGNRVRWEFAQRGTKAPCTFYWHNGTSEQILPKLPSDWGYGQNLPGSGTFYYGDKQVGYTDERSNNPRLANRDAMIAFKQAGYPEEKYPRVQKGGPFREWVRAIKGDGPEPGCNFDYASPFTETMLVGVLAARFGGRIEWDSKQMKVTNRPELNAYIREPVRKGWEYAV